MRNAQPPAPPSGRTGPPAHPVSILVRPRIERLGPVHSQRLPDGRVLIELEVSGRGLLLVGRRICQFKGATVRRYAVPAGRPFRATVLSLTGLDSRAIVPEATLASSPEPVESPRPAFAQFMRRPALKTRPRPISMRPIRIPVRPAGIDMPAVVTRCRVRIPSCVPTAVGLAVTVPAPVIERERLRPPARATHSGRRGTEGGAE